MSHKLPYVCRISVLPVYMYVSDKHESPTHVHVMLCLWVGISEEHVCMVWCRLASVCSAVSQALGKFTERYEAVAGASWEGRFSVL